MPVHDWHDIILNRLFNSEHRRNNIVRYILRTLIIDPTIVRRLNGKGCGDGKTCYNGDYGYEGSYAYRMYLNYLNVNAYLYDFNKDFGFSVRCVKDE